ncbi:transposase [Streptomyces acidicola]|uniref:transposase n=1 Tax=Streptomyces acidicola TaxID=2596892 RepID=UPI00381E5D44
MREVRRQQLAEEIEEIFHGSGCTYGSPKVLIELVRRGWRVSVNTVAKRLVERSGDPMDRRPDRRIVDNPAEVRHLELLQPVRQHQCLVTRELDRDLAIAHAHPYGSARPRPREPTGLRPRPNT